MAKIITLDEAIRKGIIVEGDWINPHELYAGNNTKIVLSTSDTGTMTQSFKKEIDLRCFYAKDSQGIDTLWFDTTRTQLKLSGKKGFLNAINKLNKICSIYSNPKRGMAARTTSKDDIIELAKFGETRQKLCAYDEGSWLGDHYMYNDERDTLLGLYVSNKDLANVFYLYSNMRGEYYGSFGIRPAVSLFLTPLIYVDVESKDENGAWRLLRY